MFCALKPSRHPASFNLSCCCCSHWRCNSAGSSNVDLRSCCVCFCCWVPLIVAPKLGNVETWKKLAHLFTAQRCCGEFGAVPVWVLKTLCVKSQDFKFDLCLGLPLWIKQFIELQISNKSDVFLSKKYVWDIPANTRNICVRMIFCSYVSCIAPVLLGSLVHWDLLFLVDQVFCSFKMLHLDR